MAKVNSSVPRATTVAAGLRADILAGRLEPARRLTFPELCVTYGVSVGVLREALVRLVDRGIVRAESNLGFSVMTLSPQDLAGLTQVRAHLEPNFVREAIDTGSGKWEAQVVAAHHLLDRASMTEDGVLSADWSGLHAEFHLALVAGCGNRRMMEMTSRLGDEADLYQRWYLTGERLDHDGDRTCREHRALLDAVLKRDAPLAAGLLRQHIHGDTDVWIGTLAA